MRGARQWAARSLGVGAGLAPARGRAQGPPLRRLLACLVVLGACAEQAPPVDEGRAAVPRPPVEARAAVDRAVATTGDVLTFRVTVDHDPGYEVEIPEAGARIEGFRIVDVEREEPAERGGRVVREHTYRLRADLVGSYILPSIAVRYRPADAPAEAVAGAVETSEIFVEVESVLPTDGSAEDIRELKPLRRLEQTRPWWIYAVGLGAVAALAVALWFYRRRRSEAPAAPPEPAHEVAFRALDALRATDFEDPQAVRRFYFLVSETIRTYVEGRFGLNATDLTTEEILDRLPSVAEIASAEAGRLGGFLEHTDQVKFAEHRPSESEIEGAYESALAFVEATVPRPEEPDEELAA